MANKIKKHHFLKFVIIFLIVLLITYLTTSLITKKWNPIDWFKGADKCKTDSDCKSGYHCSGGDCHQTEGCQSPTDCKQSFHCIKNQCIKDECENDPDCQHGFRCINWQCLTSCGVDTDCQNNYFCDSGKCVKKQCTKDPDCAKGFTCKHWQCQKVDDSCQSSADCPSGYYCNLSTNKCVKMCTDDDDCPKGYDCDTKTNECIQHVDPGIIEDGKAYLIKNLKDNTYLTLGAFCPYDPSKYGMGYFGPLLTGAKKGYQTFVAHDAGNKNWYFTITFDNNKYYLSRGSNGYIMAVKSTQSSAVWSVDKQSVISDPAKSVMLASQTTNISPYPSGSDECPNCADISFNLAKLVKYGKGHTFSVTTTTGIQIDPIALELHSGRWYNLVSQMGIHNRKDASSYLFTSPLHTPPNSGEDSAITFGPQVTQPKCGAGCWLLSCKDKICIDKGGQYCDYSGVNASKFQITQKSGGESFSIYSAVSVCPCANKLPLSGMLFSGYLSLRNQKDPRTLLTLSTSPVYWAIDKYGRIMTEDQKKLISGYPIPGFWVSPEEQSDDDTALVFGPFIIDNVESSEICLSLLFTFQATSNAPLTSICFSPDPMFMSLS